MKLTLSLQWPGLLAFALLGAAVAVSIVFYATRYPALARRRTLLLGAVRTLTLLSLLFASLGPLLSYTRASRAQNRLLILTDRSGSMSVRDVPGGRSRAEAADSAALKLAEELGDRFDVRIASFDATLGAFRRPDAMPQEAARAPGGETALGDALRDAGERVDPDSVAAVLVLSDGAVNRGESPERAVSGTLPVYALEIGSGADPPTVGIAGVDAPAEVVAGRAAAVRLTVAQGARGPARGVARVLEAGRELGSAPYSLEGPGASARVTLPFTLGAPGKHFLTVALDSVAGDPLRANKRRLLAVRARPPKHLFLLLSSRFDWDLRSLARGVEEDSAWSVVWLKPSGAADVATPDGGTERFSNLLETADAVAVRLSGRALTSERDRALLRYIERGGGALLWVAPDGEIPTGDALIRSIGLSVKPWSEGRQGLTVDLAPAGRSHELSLLSGDAATASAEWKALPPILVPLSLDAAPELTPLLLAHANQQTAVVLCAGGLGAGRVAVLDAAGVYRWGLTAAGLTRGPGIEAAFFGGMRRWLSSARDSRPVRILAPDITPEGRSVPVRIALSAPAAGPVAARVTARPLGRGGTAVRDTLLPPSAEGGFAGGIDLAPGLWELRGQVERGSRPLGSDSVSVAVGSQGIEYESLHADSTSLRRLAEATGGVAAPLTAPGPVLDRLRSPEAARTRRVDVALAQGPALFLIILIGAALEWALRRRFHLL
jgi:hypothetical protein